MTERVFVVCGVFNGLEHTKKMMACLERQTWPALHTIIVDDGSTDETAEWLAKQNLPIQVLRGNGNLWWTGAMKAGISAALQQARAGDFILTMNNDCTFADDYVATIVHASRQNARAVVGSLAVWQGEPNRIVDGGVRIDWSRGEIKNFPEKTTDEIQGQELNKAIDTLTTRGTLFPVEIFEKTGNFDVKHLPHYLSDFEFGCRTKRHGFPILLSYRAVVYNDGNRTGFGEMRDGRRISARQAWDLLFARRSRSNVLDHFWFITLCCPPDLRLANYRRLAWRTLRILSLALPLRRHLIKIKDWRLMPGREFEKHKHLYLYAGNIPDSDHYAKFVGLSLDQRNERHIKHDVTRKLPLRAGSVDIYQAEDVFEHIELERLPTVLRDIHRVLKAGGILRIAVPDYRCDLLQNRSQKDASGNIIFDPLGGGRFADGKVVDGGHVWFPTYEVVRDLLAKSPFKKVKFFHYYDEKNVGVTNPIDYSIGFVRRTPDHDERVRNPYRPMSIVVDCIKE